jgi:hypothetical protein
MSQMSFPRYVDRDPRDFFYLLLKPTLPGPPIGETAFSTAGLPHPGWPHAFARAEVEDTWLVRIDASRAIPGPVRPEDARRPLAYLTGGRALAHPRARFALYARRVTEGWAGDRYGVGEPPEGARVVLGGEPLAAGSGAGAAIGVDVDGFLVYAEGASLPARMEAARVERAIALPDGVRLAFVIDPHTVGPDAYEREVDIAAALPFLANERPAAEVLFPEVEPAPYRVWGWMQDQRVRYFRGPGPARFGTPRGQ